VEDGALKRVAVLDDEQVVRSGLARLLRSAGYEPAAYASGEEFFQFLGAVQHDCLILDLRMPGMDGFEVLSHLAALESGIPIVVLTSYPSPAVRSRALAAGVSAFLEKPVDRSVLLSAIETAVASDASNRRARR